MRKYFLTLLASMLVAFAATAQSIPISQARGTAIGQTVTVTGIVTNGSEFGTIRYMQDVTAGIAVYGASFTSVQRGDEVQVTGTLVNYNNLLEMTPLSFTVLSTGNSLPAPVVITAAQMGEPYEAQLVQVEDVLFANGGQIFAATNYNFTANGLPGVVRINSGTNIPGNVIPTSPVNVVGILTQYFSAYQLLPRDTNDISAYSNFYITNQPVQSNISQTSFDINYETNIAGTTFVEYGHTPSLELGYLFGSGTTTNHNITVGGLNAADIIYLRAMSVNGTDTARSPVKDYATVSNSSGSIKCYFDRPVNNAVATISNAIQLQGSMDDTLIAYINRAKHTLDIAIYNFDQSQISDIAGAINNAYNNGVIVRVVYNESTSNPSLLLLNSGIYTLASPSGSQYGIMHNKFVVIDANSSDANDAIVWTGSTNWSQNQMYDDANNVIIFQDQSLAKAYTMEFEEMWGSNTAIPDTINSNFGPDKSDNTPHEFLIGGKRVENYFSPTDNVTNHIIEAATSANNSLYFQVMSFTRTDIATEIAGRILNNGVFVSGMMNDSANGAGVVFNIIANAIGAPNRMMLYNHATFPGILHHKLMIVDENNPSSDPLVLTGSHNWSTAAQTKNDENIVIVHDADIANQYYQEFYQQFLQNGGLLGVAENGALSSYAVYPVPNNGSFMLQYQLKTETSAKLIVRDVTGRVVAAMELEGTPGTHTQSFNFELSPAVYVVSIETENAFTSFKIVVK